MARALRVEYPGAVYHVTARGNEKRSIFADDIDRYKLLKIISQAKVKYSLKIYSYVLMPNHYHLLIETQKANLTSAMHFIQTKYTVYFNLRHKRVGHLFQGRYKALIVDKDNYLLELVRYIHLNPVRARISKLPTDFKWSSYNEYINKANLVEKKLIMEYFNNNISKFVIFNYEGIHKKWEDVAGKIYGQLIIGSKKFTDGIKQMANKATIDKEISFGRKLKKRISKEHLLDVIMNHFNISKEDLLLKKGRWNEARKIGIYLFHKFTDMPIHLIGNLFGKISGCAVSHLVSKIENQRIYNNPLNKTLQKIEYRIKI